MDVVVEGSYPAGARVLFVGQVPGATEAREGTPFVGADGQQLRAWLRAVGIDPRACAFDNIHQTYNGNPTYKPTAKETKAGVARLTPVAAEFEVVVLVGGIASKLCWPGPISKIQGRQEVRGGTLYSAMFHPGYYRNAKRDRPKTAPAIEAEVLTVLKTVAAHLAGEESTPFLPEPTAYAYAWQVKSPVRPSTIAIDVETRGETKKDTGDCRVAQFNLCAIAPAGVVLLDPPTIPQGVELVVHNVPYDAVVLDAVDNPQHDTKMLAHMMGEPDTTLKGLALRYLDRLLLSYPEAERLGVLPEYCLGDAQTTFDLLPVLLEIMDNSVRDLYYDLEKPLFPLWSRMTRDGAFYLDRPALATYREELAGRVDALTSDLQLPIDRDIRLCVKCELWAEDKEAGQRCINDGKHKWAEQHVDTTANLNAPHQVRAALAGLGIDVPDTQADTLWFFRDEPIIAALLERKRLNKELTTYIDPWLCVPEGERLGAIWNPHGTWTMRVSSRTPNMQNVPVPLWRFFHAGEGHTLLSFDHAQLEVRLAAHFSHDPLMMEAVQSEDVHGTFQKLLGIDDRRLTKVFVFGCLYGGGYESFMIAARKVAAKNPDWQMPDEATVLRGLKILRERFRVYFQWAESVRGRRVIPGLFGMVHRVPEGGSERHEENQAVNAPIQGGGGLTLKYGQLKVWQAGYEVVAQVHDSLTVRVPNQYVEEARRDIPRLMERAIPYPLDVPLLVEAK